MIAALQWLGNQCRREGDRLVLTATPRPVAPASPPVERAHPETLINPEARP